MDSSVHTFYFAPEIEAATVSILWHEPDRIPEFLRVIDPAVHFQMQPHLAIIVEAISIAYSELGVADWASVVQVIRELGRLEECGGLPGLNEIYDPHTIVPAALPHYVEMLQEYARNRKLDPPKPTYRFAGGRGTAWRNKGKARPWEPDFTGEAIVRGHRYAVTFEFSPDDNIINFRLEPK